MTREKLIEIHCKKIPGILSVDYIKNLNAAVTNPPEDKLDGDIQSIEDVDIGNMPNFELGREEDYHHLRPEGEGILSNLTEIILPQRCEKNNNALWLTAVIMNQIAENQAFGEGNKRTAYLSGTMFWLWAQYVSNRDRGIYVDLTPEFTDILSEAAVDEIGAEYIYKYMRRTIETEI